MSEMNLEVLMEPISEDFPKGLEEIAELLTFLPEEMRMAVAQSMIGAFLFS